MNGTRRPEFFAGFYPQTAIMGPMISLECTRRAKTAKLITDMK
jgi:hypothetical protein